MVLALLLSTSLPAMAANPASGSATTGQSLSVEITSPATGTVVSVPPGTLTVDGLVQVGPLTESGNVLYVVDVSGSTVAVRNMDCNGDGTVNGLDDLNTDGYVGSVLDCEIAGVVALNESLAGSPGAEAGLVAFGSVAANADVSPTGGDQPFLSPLGIDLSGNAISDMEDVARSLRPGAVTAFTAKPVSTGTHYDNALNQVLSSFAGKAGETNVAFFLSDGEPTPGSFTTGNGSPLSGIVNAGVVVNTYSVGTSAGGCSPGTPLSMIASATGGSCTEVIDPSDLASVLIQPVTIDYVDVRLNGGSPVVASLTGSTWTTSLSGLVYGPNTVEATLIASDGTQVTADVIVYGNGAPMVDASGPYTLYEGESLTLSGSGSDPNGDMLTYQWSPTAHLTGADTATPTYTGMDDETETLTLTVTDPFGSSASDTAAVTVMNVAPVINSLTLSTEPQPVGATVTAIATFTDAGILDTHTALIEWGDGTSGSGLVTEASGSGTVDASHAYGAAGIYTVTITLTDDDGGVVTAIHEYAVVYDPDGGFVTGGGWIDSPPGAYQPDPTVSGRANLGFVAKYRNGASEPIGSTEFQFKAGDLNFHSTSYDWLVVAGARAQFKGDGTINGSGDYHFMLTAIDGQVAGGGGVDRFRIRIWDKASGGLIYDNQSGDPDDADPSTALLGGAIKIHRG